MLVLLTLVSDTKQIVLRNYFLTKLFYSWFRYRAFLHIFRASGPSFSIAYKTVSLLMSWMLAMVLNPKVQACAQEEIDSVVGHTRLPSFKDRPKLPYIEAMLTETLRWGPITPLGSHVSLCHLRLVSAQ